MRIFILLLLSTFYVAAQPMVKKDHSQTDWYLKFLLENPHYPTIKKLYDNYFVENPYEKGLQKSIVRRWLDVYENYQDSTGKINQKQWLGDDYDRYLKLNTFDAKNARLAADSPYPEWNDVVGTWRMIGPYHAKKTKCTGIASYMSGGFNDRVYINPYNTNNLFSGQSYGGLWVSQDKGATWKLTDAEFPNGKNTYANRDIYYGEIEAHPKNAKLVYAASEAGLLKSENGGDNWTLVKDLNYQTRATERAYFVALDPNNTQKVLASYGRKIYASADGGSTWKVVFDNSTGGSNLSRGQHNTNGIGARWYNIFGLEFHPTQANVVYMGAYNAANEACIYRSTNAGESFQLLKNLGTKVWLKLQLTKAAPDKFYCFEMFVGSGSKIYKYDLEGNLKHQTTLPTLSSSVDDIVAADADSSVFYFGGYYSGAVYKSTDGGLNFTAVNPGYTNCPNYIHPDVRAFSVVGNDVLVATDGGPYLSKDAMKTVRETGDWISGIDLWGFSASFKDDVVAAGCDHGPTKVRLFDGPFGWVEIGGGDASDITVNPVDSRWVYANDGYNKFRVQISDDYKTISSRKSVVTANFKYLAFHPNIYYQAYAFQTNVLMLSKDNMATSTPLYTFTENITKIKLSAKDPNIIYVLTNRKNIWKSTDAGVSFTNITPTASQSSNQTLISDFDLGGNNKDEIWLSYGGLQSVCKVLQSTDGGVSWSNVTATLPQAVISQISYQRGTDGGIYVSTDGGGIWYKNNTSKDWSLLGQGLPMMGYVKSTYTVPLKNKLRMGTSRGAFEHELIEKSKAEAQIAVNKNLTDYKAVDSLAFRDYSAYYGNKNIKFEWLFEGGSPNSSTLENPKVLYKMAGKFDVTLKITDSFGNTSIQKLEDFITVTGPIVTGLLPDITPKVEVIPNPTNQHTMMVKLTNIPQPEFTLTNISGQSLGIKTKQSGDLWHIQPRQNIPNGTYIITIKSANEKWTQKVLIE